MPVPILPLFMARKINLSAEPDNPKASSITGVLLRSRRHRSPEQMPENCVAIVYEPNPDERTAIAGGAPIVVSQVTYGKPPNEQLVHIGLDTAAEYYAVEEATPERLMAVREAAEEEMGKAVQAYLGAIREQATMANNPDSVSAKDERRAMGNYGAALQRVGAALTALGEANQVAGFGAN